MGTACAPVLIVKEINMSNRSAPASREEALRMLRRYEAIIIRVNRQLDDEGATPEDHVEFDAAEQQILDALCDGPTPSGWAVQRKISPRRRSTLTASRPLLLDSVR
ncbi:hypothetical protein ASF71_17950 [Deinococcus sp. Leaf326]|nr:hypothetical protein ASF71_17950 [Deinococcus sp. Leaf326]